MKKRFLKLMTIMMAATMAMATLSGCGKDSKETNSKAESKELNIAVFEGGHGKEYWEEAVKRFEKDHPGVKINMECNPKIGDIIRPKISSGNPPDFIYLGSSDPSGIADALVKDKALEDLTDLFDGKAPDKDGKLRDKMLDGFLDTPLVSPYGDKKIYLAPLYYNVTGLWYNKTYFEQKGWKAPETWDEFFALGEKAKAEGKALFTYQGKNPGYAEAIMFPSLASAGGLDTLNGVLNYKEGIWNTEAAKKTLGIFEQIATKDYLLKGTVAMTHTQAQTEFLQGKALFIPNGNWFEGEMKDAIPKEGFSFGFMAPPVFRAGDTRYEAVMIEQMYIPSKAKNKELAKEFLKYQYRDDMVKLNAEKAQAIVPIKGSIDMAKEFIPKSNYECFKPLEQNVKPITMGFKAVPGSEVNMRKEVFNPLSSVMNKELTAEKWAERLETSSTKCREKAGK